MQPDLSAGDFRNYIQVNTPEVGEPGDPDFFHNLVGQFDPDKHWLNVPSESMQDTKPMPSGWMYAAGIVIAKDTGRTEEFIEALRESDDIEMQVRTLLELADEESRPDLAEEAVLSWEAYVLEKEEEPDLDFIEAEPSDIYSGMRSLGARFNLPDVFESGMVHLPIEQQIHSLFELPKVESADYLENILNRLENGDDNPALAFSLMDRALMDGQDYIRALRAINTTRDVFLGWELDRFDMVIDVAAGKDELEQLKEAVLKYTHGFHRFNFALKTAERHHDEESIHLAADTLDAIPVEEEGSEIVYGYTVKVIDAVKDFPDETKDEIKEKVNKFINKEFYKAYASGDMMTAFDAALGSLKVNASFRLIKELIFRNDDAEEVVTEIIDKMKAEGQWGVLSAPALISAIQKGENDLQVLKLQYQLRLQTEGMDSFERESVRQEAGEMLAKNYIDPKEYRRIIEFLDIKI